MPFSLPVDNNTADSEQGSSDNCVNDSQDQIGSYGGEKSACQAVLPGGVQQTIVTRVVIADFQLGDTLAGAIILNFKQTVTIGKSVPANRLNAAGQDNGGQIGAVGEGVRPDTGKAFR